MSVGQDGSDVSRRHVRVGVDRERVVDAGVMTIGVVFNLSLGHRRVKRRSDRRDAPRGTFTLLGA